MVAKLTKNSIVAITLVWLTSCAVLDGVKPTPVKVYLDSGFYGSKVEVFVDGDSLYKGNITTDEISGLADTFFIEKHARFRMDFYLNGEHVRIWRFDSRKGRYIRIYVDQDRLEYVQSRKRFYYN